MKHIRWKILLSVFQCVLALILIVFGRAATAAHSHDFRTTGSHSYDMPSWDYVPMTTQIVHGLNFPAMIVSSPLEHLDRYTPAIWITGYLVCVCGLWYWVGSTMEQRKNVDEISRRRPTPMRVLCGALALACGFLAYLAVVSLLRGHRPVTNLGGLFWSLLGVAYLGRRAIQVGSPR